MSMFNDYPGFPRKVVDCSKDPVVVVQADANEADINKIVARMNKTGQMPRMADGEPFYGDISEFTGLQDAYIKVQEANELFMSMDASIRTRFDNDPVKMVEFLEDPSNYDEALELGMVVKRPKVSEPDPGVPEVPPSPVPEPVK